MDFWTPATSRSRPWSSAIALASLRQFAERIKGRNDWNDMHTRSAWAGAHHGARLGDYRLARRHLKSACVQLRYNGLAPEFVAATIDRCQLICRGVEPRGDSPEVALELVDACLKQRTDLSDLHREGLGEIQTVLGREPENAFGKLVAFRRSFIAPVPGAMAERIGAA